MLPGWLAGRCCCCSYSNCLSDISLSCLNILPTAPVKMSREKTSFASIDKVPDGHQIRLEPTAFDRSVSFHFGTLDLLFIDYYPIIIISTKRRGKKRGKKKKNVFLSFARRSLAPEGGSRADITQHHVIPIPVKEFLFQPKILPVIFSPSIGNIDKRCALYSEASISSGCTVRQKETHS